MTAYRDTMIGLLQAVEIEKGKDNSEFQKLLKEQLKDPEFKKEWESFQPEMEAIRKEMKKYINFDDMLADPEYFSDEDREKISDEANQIVKKKFSPRGSSWDDLKKELYTPEEIEESNKRVAEINKTIK